MPEPETLSSSSLATLRQCPFRYWLQYELLLRPAGEDAKPLRMGSAFHAGLEARDRGADESAAIARAVAGYAGPAPGDPYDWQIERETVRALLAGHFWRYRDDTTVRVERAEVRFRMPLVNPETGRSSRTFVLVGKIDGLGTLAGRPVVVERKTTGSSIEEGSDFWPRLRFDPQISQYVLAAQWLGENAWTIVYDVARKPTISPLSVPILDGDGLKIVRDGQGRRVLTKQGKPRQTGSASAGWVLQTRPESPDEWRERLLADIGERPDYYYARREIPRLEGDLRAFQAELWQQAEHLRHCRGRGLWFRNVSQWNCRHCEYAGPCLSGVEIDPDPQSPPPLGFRRSEHRHPELEESRPYEQAADETDHAAEQAVVCAEA